MAIYEFRILIDRPSSHTTSHRKMERWKGGIQYNAIQWLAKDMYLKTELILLFYSILFYFIVIVLYGIVLYFVD
jgi:hypothetical protein